MTRIIHLGRTPQPDCRRLGGLVKQLLDQRGQHGAPHGAVGFVLSDGSERGDAALLAKQMARLHRLAFHGLAALEHLADVVRGVGRGGARA